jgi:DNA (cytosine-5)-methyltransferase 1
VTYRILDLFCGAGGSAMGYRRAGFEVSGVDNVPQPRYPFEFNCLDALTMLRDAIATNLFERARIDAIHASPPCQAYSVTKSLVKTQDQEQVYPKLIGPVRELCKQIGVPYVIENVVGARADMQDPIQMCGSSVGRFTFWKEREVYLQRHRLFECSFPVEQLPCAHVKGGYRAVTVAGHGRMGIDGRNDVFAGAGYEELKRDVMGIDWMNRNELGEAIPPAYTEHVGKYLIKHLDSTSNHERLEAA